jgi:hypothetical protein
LRFELATVIDRNLGMDQHEDYADNDLPPPFVLWFEIARNLLIVVVLVGLALILSGIVLVKVSSMRRAPLPKLPEHDYLQLQPDTK